jgi:rare lipoprotein A
MRFAMRHWKFIAIAPIAVWLAVHPAPAAAQSFDDRWSIIPKAHADPAPMAPETRPNLQLPHLQAPSVAPPADGTSDHLSPTPKVFSGKASFYSYSSGKTASGESFDRDQLTAAHRTLPFGTRVRVTELRTGRSVIVRITDRGPAIGSRVLDLSMAAARSLGITDRGVTEIRAEVL